ncbi:glycosyltransferase [Candidatus Saccharibacteria bacterium]|nr:glycosyltransferase [Candidatus Saccharibacteria bacterium]
MKIAIFTDVFLDITGGIVTSIRAQKNQLEKMGHEVYLFTSGFKRSKAELKKLADKHIFIVPTCKVFFKPLVPIARRPAKIEKWVVKNFPDFPNFDVVHVHYEGGCSIAGIRLAKKYNIRLVQTMHGREDEGVHDIVPAPFRLLVATLLNWFHSWYLPHDYKVKKDNNLANSRARAKMWTLMINHANQADVVLTPSHHFGAKLKEYGVKRPMDVVSNGVEDDFVLEKVPVRELKPGNKFDIIWNSRLDKNKHIMQFLEALTMVKCPYSLSAFGDGLEEKKAKRYAKKHNLNVKFYGHIERDLILEKMNNCQLSVLASYHFDNQPMTIVEAVVRGMPVLICDPDMKEIMPSGGYVLADGPEPAALARAIDELYAEPAKIAKMSEIMIKHRGEKKQSIQVEKLLKVYSGSKK